MVENFSAFDYKTLEEVLTVIKHLTSVLSTAGMQLVEVLSPSNLLTQLHGTAEASSNATEPQQPVSPHVRIRRCLANTFYRLNQVLLLPQLKL